MLLKYAACLFAFEYKKEDLRYVLVYTTYLRVSGPAGTGLQYTRKYTDRDRGARCTLRALSNKRKAAVAVKCIYF